MTYSVFNSNNRKDHTTATMFLDASGTVTMQRYDTLKYRQFDKLTDKQLGFFWRPEEIDVTRDSKDFRDLTDHEQHIFTSNLKRQILLDSVQLFTAAAILISFATSTATLAKCLMK